MQLGIIASPTEESFRSAASKGLEFLEFCINIGYNTDEFFNSVGKLKEWSKEYNVKIGSIGRWGTDRIDKKGKVIQGELDISRKLIDTAEYLECKNFVCGCNYIEELSYYENCTAAIEFLTLLIDHGRKHGVKISAYNCHWNNFIVSNMAWTLVHGYLKELGIKYDPSHSIYAGNDYLKETRDWGERFYHVHIKGALVVEGQRFDDPPAGMDQTDWGSFMSILYAKGYNGGLSIEPHSRTWTGKLGDMGVDYTIRYMKQLIF